MTATLNARSTTSPATFEDTCVRHIGTTDSRLDVTITGDVSASERLDTLVVLQEIWRDTDGARFARCRIAARVDPNGRSMVEGAMILGDGRAVFAWSDDRTLIDAVRDISRRLHAQMYAAAA